MPTTLPKKERAKPRSEWGDVAGERSAVTATLFVALALAVTTGAAPPQLVLPALSFIVLTAGLSLGAYSMAARYLRGRANDRLIDIAGVLVLFGFAATILSDKADALQWLGELAGTVRGPGAT